MNDDTFHYSKLCPDVQHLGLFSGPQVTTAQAPLKNAFLKILNIISMKLYNDMSQKQVPN